MQERFRAYVDTSAIQVARDLASLLDRARELGIAICPDVDPEGISYSIEWASDGISRDISVEWVPDRAKWVFMMRVNDDTHSCENCDGIDPGSCMTRGGEGV